MAELAKTKGRNGVRNKFDTIEEEAEEENWFIIFYITCKSCI